MAKQKPAAQRTAAQKSEAPAPPASDRPQPTNVIQALAAVMSELPGIGRDQRSEQGYVYRGIEAITEHAQKLLGKYGVVFVPCVTHRDTLPLTINNKPWTQEELEVVYTVYGPGGVDDKITVGPLFGLGRDNSDKGANKALTQAYKYALLQTLCVGDSKDDADKGEAAVADAVVKQTPDELAQAKGWADKAELDAAGERFREKFNALTPDEKTAVSKWRRANQLVPSDTPEKAWASLGFMALGCDPNTPLKTAVQVGETGEVPPQAVDKPADEPAPETVGDLITQAQLAVEGDEPAVAAQHAEEMAETREAANPADVEASVDAATYDDDDPARPF